MRVLKCYGVIKQAVKVSLYRDTLSFDATRALWANVCRNRTYTRDDLGTVSVFRDWLQFYGCLCLEEFKSSFGLGYTEEFEGYHVLQREDLHLLVGVRNQAQF